MARRFTSFEQLPKISELQPYQINSATAGIQYIRFNNNSEHELIIKVTEISSITTIEKAFDLWTNIAGATYVGIGDKFIEGVNTPTPL